MVHHMTFSFSFDWPTESLNGTTLSSFQKDFIETLFSVFYLIYFVQEIQPKNYYRSYISPIQKCDLCTAHVLKESSDYIS